MAFLRNRPQARDRGAPPAKGLAGQCVRFHVRVAVEQGMDGTAEVAYPLTVDDSHPQDILFPTKPEVFQDDFFDMCRWDGMQIQPAVNRNFHRRILVPIRGIPGCIAVHLSPA